MPLLPILVSSVLSGLSGLPVPSALPPQLAGSPQDSTPPSNAPAETTWRLRFVELALSDESATLGFRTTALEDRGFIGLNATVNEDDDVALGGELLRVAEFDSISTRLGIGLGAHAIFVDRPDANVYGLSLSGLAEYDFGTTIPTALGLKLAYAPDVTTFDDGDAILEALLRFSVDLSDYATAYAGFHLLQVDVGPHVEVDDRLQLGVRLGF